jgi:hypothetical protein
MFITTTDLVPFATIHVAKATAMIADAEALAIMSVPGLVPAVDATPLTEQQLSAVRAILRTAILRWNDAGNGAVTQQTAGIFGQSVDTRAPRYGGLTDSEINRLRLVVAPTSTGAFNLDMSPGATIHAPWCDLYFGALYCSCGADIATVPIYGGYY